MLTAAAVQWVEHLTPKPFPELRHHFDRNTKWIFFANASPWS